MHSTRGSTNVGITISTWVSCDAPHCLPEPREVLVINDIHSHHERPRRMNGQPCIRDLRLTVRWAAKLNTTLRWRVPEVINQFCTFPALERVKLLQRTFLNFLVGNDDMHLKNFSLIMRVAIKR